MNYCMFTFNYFVQESTVKYVISIHRSHSRTSHKTNHIISLMSLPTIQSPTLQ